MSDSVPTAFRTAVGGFRKDDVSSYIARTARDHQAEVEALQKEIARLKQENAQLREQLQEASEQVPEMPEISLPDMELTAYRRAEAVLRQAYRQADRLRLRMQEICDAAREDMDAMDTAANTAMDAMEAGVRDFRAAADILLKSLGASVEQLRELDIAEPDPAEELEEL